MRRSSVLIGVLDLALGLLGQMREVLFVHAGRALVRIVFTAEVLSGTLVLANLFLFLFLVFFGIDLSSCFVLVSKLVGLSDMIL